VCIVAPGRLSDARLYFVTDAETDEGILDEALAGGVDVLQLREKHLPDEEILAAAARFRRLCDEHGALFVVNDRPDLALAAGADGVHVGQGDEPVAAVRERVGDDLVIGLSTHSAEQLATGLESAADYVCVGPVYATPTKPDYPAVGLELVERAAAARSERPWFAIGGIDGANVSEVAAAGARRVVVVRAIRDAPDPRVAAAGLRQALEEADAGGQ
jgi:thiamine-phosphate pyrophosphorylase